MSSSSLNIGCTEPKQRPVLPFASRGHKRTFLKMCTYTRLWMCAREGGRICHAQHVCGKLVSKGFITICGLDLPLVLTTSRWGITKICRFCHTERNKSGEMQNTPFVQVLQQRGLEFNRGWLVRILPQNALWDLSISVQGSPSGRRHFLLTLLGSMDTASWKLYAVSRYIMISNVPHNTTWFPQTINEWMN